MENPVLTSLIYVLVSCLILFLSKILFNKIYSYKIEEQIKEGNCTPIIAFCGYILGITAILIGVFIGPSNANYTYDLLTYLSYSILGIVLMNISGIIADKLILYKFDSAKEMIEDKNIGTAVVHFGIYLASGLIISACVNGEYGGIISSIVYYILGMLFLFVFLKIYDLITPYSIHDELEKDNYAAGIALSGNIIAIGLILMKATLGDIEDWQRSAVLYFIDLLSIVLLLPSIRLILGNFIIKNINSLIKENNVGAGLIEFITIISFALVVFFMVDFIALV